MELDTVNCVDLLTLCDTLPDASVDMILCDPPYGTTTHSWDEVIPLAPMWEQFKRVIKPLGAIVLTSSQPFTSVLVCSNPEMFKYDIIWKKTRPMGFAHANNMVMHLHENILVFSPGTVYHKNQSTHRMTFNPQKSKGKAYTKKNYHGTRFAWDSMQRPSTAHDHTTTNEGDRYPVSVIEFSNDNHASLHPTQKPVALFEYLIRTYTDPGNVVFDPTCGSGTTAIAARNTDRHFICGDISAEYVEVARKRLRDTDPFQSTEVHPGIVQQSLFDDQSR